MSIERRCEHRCPVAGDLIGKTIMHLLGCHQRDAAVTMLFVVPGEEAMILLGAEHGASKQEILSLKWSEIDFEFDGKGLIRLYRKKNKKERVRLLMPRTKRALMDWQDHLNRIRHRKKISHVISNYVFCHLDGTPITNFNKAWWKALEIAGIEDFHFHDLRHTYCSNLILSGAGLKEVKDMIGHSDIAMTDRYSHLPNSYMN